MMPLRIKKKGFTEFLLLALCILISYRFFYLISYSEILSKVHWLFNRSLIYAVITGAYFFLIYKCKTKSRWLTRYCLTLYLSVSALLVYSVVTLPRQSFFDTIRAACVFLIPLFATIFLDYFVKEGSTDKMLSFLNVVSLIWNLLLIVQSFLYRQGVLIFDFQSYFIDGSVYTRNDAIRMHTGILSQCMILYNFSYLFRSRMSKTRKWFYHLALFLIGMYCIFFVSQTRAEEVYILIALAVIVLIGGKSTRSRILTVIALAIGIYLVNSSGFIDKIAEIFGSAMRETNSVSHRLYAYQYYFDCIRNRWFMGNGFTLASNTSYPYFTLEHGTLGVAYYSDVGIVGLLANVGLMAIPIFIWPMIHIGINIIKVIKRTSVKEMSFEIAFFVYLVLSSATLITTDGEKMLQFAFVLAFYEFLYMSCVKRQKNTMENIMRK